MTLFATLTSDKSADGGSSSCSPPEAIQLHGNKFINFLSAKTVNLDDNNDATDPRQFSALSYQAVQTQREDVAGITAAPRQNLRPDLGIWDCRIQSSSSNTAVVDNTAMLLQRVIVNKKGGNTSNNQVDENVQDKKNEGDTAAEQSGTKDEVELPPTVVLTVDTTTPNSVQPSLEQMRNVLLKMMATTESTENNTSLSRQSIKTTTSMKVLQSSPFGVTKITESVGSLQDSSSRVAIIIAAIVDASSSSSSSNGKSAADEFKERQARSLVLYHLHKFALECDCTLCFVSDDDKNDGLTEGVKKLSIGDDKEDNNTGVDSKNKSALSIDELGRVIRRVAMGLSPVEDNVVAEGESKVENVAVSLEVSTAIHAPGTHDADLIHGAYLRNASCEGSWDAAKDDLIVALPPQSTQSDSSQQKKESKGSTNGGGDEEWLSKLADSVGLTPDIVTSASNEATSTASITPKGKKSPKRERLAVKKRSTRSAASKSKDGKPKDQKEVMNFFDDLLKK